MSETAGVAKIMIMIGVIFILVGALSPGAADAWASFSATVYTAPDMPEFNDPFVETDFATTQLTPDGNSSWEPDAPPVVGCPADAYYMCLWNHSRNNESYIELDSLDFQFSISMDVKALRPPREIVMVFFDVACYSSTNVSWVSFLRDESGLIEDFFQGHCTPNSWRVTRERWEGQTALGVGLPGYSTFFDQNGGMQILFAVANQTARLSYMRVILMMSTETTCPTFGEWWSIGDNLQVIACQIGKFINTGVRMAFWVINAIVFVAQSIIAVGAYIGAVIGALAMGIATSIAYLLAIPGAPVAVQAIVAALFLGILMFLGIVVARIISSAIPG